jgi:5'-3' exonuclease
MGINSFYEAFVNNKSTRLVNIKDLSGRRVAIDISVMIMSSVNVQMVMKGPDGLVTNHIATVLNNIIKLYENGILPVCIFDPKKHIITKSEVQKKRGEAAKERNENKIKDFKESQENYEKEIEMIKNLKLGDEVEAEYTASINSKYKALFDSKNMYNKYFTGDPTVFKIAKADTLQILESLNVPYIIAPDGVEAEQLCALLCKSGAVDFVWTKDMDALVFGSPRIIFREKGSTKYRVIERKSILEDKKITEGELIRMSVALGSDFADKIRGIGPTTVFTKMANVEFDERQKAAIEYFENKNIDEKVKAEVKEKWRVAMQNAIKPTNNVVELIKWLGDNKGFTKVLPKLEKLFTLNK